MENIRKNPLGTPQKINTKADDFDCLSSFSSYTVKKSISIDSLTSIHYFEFDDTFIDKLEAHEPWELVYVDRGACDIIADDATI